ncbi:MAG: Asp-tRNA(Asn)/Glu-tRNA(Gln) amidotransferase GatCAB subunit C [Waddliaceae bacterium]|nr:Asp-tRNA(Asn)/Glu-tRNA(Gln) amidotransferase GatCAB subunit C [Waddliaceae bacterium]
MVEVNQDLMNKLMRLCRIDFSEIEQKELMTHLRRILDYVSQLDEVDTEDVKPCNHVLEDVYNVFREDQVGESLPRQTFLDNSPSQVGGMIRVPPVIKKHKS